MELLLELLPDPELGYEGTGTGGAAEGRGQRAGTVPAPPPAPAWPAHGQQVDGSRGAERKPPPPTQRTQQWRGRPQLLSR